MRGMLVKDVDISEVGYPPTSALRVELGPVRQDTTTLKKSFDRLVAALSITLRFFMKERCSKKRFLADFDMLSKEVRDNFWALHITGNVESTLKNFCAWPMARLLGESLPATQKGIHYENLFGPQIRKYILCRIPAGRMGMRPSVSCIALANSLLSLKDCSLEVPECFIEDSFLNYKKALSAPPVPVSDRVVVVESCENDSNNPVVARLVMEVDSSIKQAIHLTVCEIFPDLSECVKLDDQEIPSSSASCDYSRAKGGMWEDLLQNQRLIPKDPTQRFLSFLGPKDLIMMSYDVSKRRCVSIYGRPVSIHGCYVEGGVCPAKAVPILEACKVRWVNCGSAGPYFRAKSWNRLVYRFLPKHPTFALTGRPCNVDDINRVGKGKYLLSGDYKGATDTLDPAFSLYALRAINNRLYGYEEGALRTEKLGPLLTSHELTYTRKVGGESLSTTFVQKNGQLMGSFLSFPILCILNAAINRLYLDRTLETPLRDLPMLINGDDIAMSSEDGFNNWSDHVGLIGLSPSLGKNYVHDSVCCINSEFYRRAGPVTDGRFDRVFPVRTNLVFAQQKGDSGGGVQGTRLYYNGGTWISTLGSKARTLVENMDEAHASFLLQEFISANDEELKGTKRNWYVPEPLGGLGLPLTKWTLPSVSLAARQVASFLYYAPSPKDIQRFCPVGDSLLSVACTEWMRACEKLQPCKGLEYRWLLDDDVEVPDSVRLSDFIGFGSLPAPDTDKIHVYDNLVMEARKAVNAKVVPLISNRDLLQFSLKPRKAGWVRKAVA